LEQFKRISIAGKYLILLKSLGIEVFLGIGYYLFLFYSTVVFAMQTAAALGSYYSGKTGICPQRL
jgi:hypothetical protein